MASSVYQIVKKKKKNSENQRQNCLYFGQQNLCSPKNENRVYYSNYLCDNFWKLAREYLSVPYLITPIY